MNGLILQSVEDSLAIESKVKKLVKRVADCAKAV